MTTSLQQASINIAKQIDKLRLWAAGNDPDLAQTINQAIANELGNQSVGVAPSRLLGPAGAGFGTGTSAIGGGVDSITGALTNTGSLSFANIGTDTTSSGSISGTSSDNFLGVDMSGLANMFGSAGSGATPALADTSVASNPASISGVLNNISNDVSSAIRAVYAPQETLAIAQGQLATIQAQAQAAQLGVVAQAQTATSLSKLLPYALIGVIGIFAIRAMGTTRTENYSHKRKSNG